jgi:hypothetical protein
VFGLVDEKNERSERTRRRSESSRSMESYICTGGCNSEWRESKERKKKKTNPMRERSMKEGS